jgi:hypothetical protein
MVKQPDYLGDLVRVLRLGSAAVLAAFALLVSLCAFFATVIAVIGAALGDWDGAEVVATAGAVYGLVAAGLIWTSHWLFRGGGAAGRPSVFPLWFIQLIGVVFLPGAVTAAGAAVKHGDATLLVQAAALTVGPSVAMILIPWLVRRRARKWERVPGLIPRESTQQEPTP